MRLSGAWLCALTLVPLNTGCDNASPPPPTPGPASGGTLQIITDPAAVEAVRRAAESSTSETFATERLLDEPYLLNDFLAAGVAKEHLASECRDRLDDTAPAIRVTAAALLLAVGDPASAPALTAVVGSGADDECSEAFSALSMVDSGDGLVWKSLSTEQAFRDAVLTRLSRAQGPGLLNGLFIAIRHLQIKEAVPRLRELSRGRSDLAPRAAMALAAIDPSEETLQLLRERMLNDEPPARLYWWVTALEQWCEAHKNEPSSTAGRLAADLLARFGEHPRVLEDTPLSTLLAIIGQMKLVDASTTLQALATTTSRPPWIRAKALTTWARVEPDKATDILTRALSSPNTRIEAAEELGRIKRGSADDAAIASLRAAATDELRPRALGALALAALAIGGPDALAFARELEPRLDPYDRMDVHCVLEGVTPDRVHELLVALDLVPTTAARLSESDGDLTPPAREAVFDALIDHKRALMFDVETGVVPVRHDHLLRDLATISAGEFEPLAVEHYEPPAGDDAEGRYTIEFVHADRLYRFAARDLGDWYDLEAVVNAANAALANSGAGQRFIALHGDGQVATLVFGNPQAVQRLTDELLLPLDANLNAAMESGKAFERHVTEQLQKPPP